MVEKQEEPKLKKSYPVLEKKYSLPSIESIEENFGEIESEHEPNVLSAVRKKISEKIEYATSLLSNILDGETNLVNIYESKALDEKTRADLFRMYRKLMKYSREANILTLFYNEKEEAKFISEFSKEWDLIKNEIKKHLEKFRDSWDDDNEISDDILNYLG